MELMQRTFDIGDWEWHERGDGRTIVGRMVPYNEVAEITERHKETGEIVTFREQFLPKSCMGMVQAAEQRGGNAGWIKLRIEHTDDFQSWVGYADSLRDASDGGYATFRLYESMDLDKVRSILKETHHGLSVNFGARATPLMLDGVVSHRQIHVEHVAATPVPCYSGAKILAMRDGIDDAVSEIGTPHLDSVRAMLDEIRKVPV